MSKLAILALTALTTCGSIAAADTWQGDDFHAPIEGFGGIGLNDLQAYAHGLANIVICEAGESTCEHDLWSYDIKMTASISESLGNDSILHPEVLEAYVLAITNIVLCEKRAAQCEYDILTFDLEFAHTVHALLGE